MNVKNRKVLVVDDEVVIADTLVTILMRAGYTARAAYSGEDALDCCTAFTPDLLLSDVVMEGIDGIETAIRMRALIPGLRVLLFSGKACTVDLLKEAWARGHEFETLSKPVHPKDLLAKLHDESSGTMSEAHSNPEPVRSARATG